MSNEPRWSTTRLANEGDTTWGNSTSEDFLQSIADDVIDRAAWCAANGEEWTEDAWQDAGTLSEIADAAVPIYTADLWKTFAHCHAYNEDPTELGCDGSDMHQAARVCLYMIAERVAAFCIRDLNETGLDQ